ncbi:SMI1/KNR4 family protein [Clostridium estertheticum]|uniref:SMI1/KNR4 family protein n=1 Tax=Clostridium estertheticum TaxID=238834 RepID=A0AA47I814_9CLOT|nr:YrhA family protein [Clostridium estertheticum]MBU3157986.1 SMI1/KNR4 family protein [Clostridium estertheticum]MBU3202382.1 SMI1/KNR4 family protein [Clostridium estertheticum]WAG62153.1 SMI1/KNR4 family protein [Clostridium estertheticum]WAG63730.1 SMI1/KNR4 family protein [Clostridium estertheticum]
MWEQLFFKIKDKREKRGRKLNNPALEEQIEILKKTVKEKFNQVLPEQYVNFLKTTNGLEFNGFIFYGVDTSLFDVQNNQTVYGYVDTNEIWYENEHQKQYMFFGEGSISWHCFDLLNEVYVELDNPSGTVMQTYPDFNSMLERALEDSLL